MSLWIEDRKTASLTKRCVGVSPHVANNWNS